MEKFKSSRQKLTFWGRFCWEDEKRNSVILCQFNCWVVCLLKKKKENLWEKKKNEEKRLKQKKIVVLSCFKFCWDSFLILWKTPSFSPHCCWNYYLLLYILLREKSGRGNHISFQATPICWFYDARCWKKKKYFCSALLLSSPVSKFCVTTQK